jgi:acetylglutamate kinase
MDSAIRKAEALIEALSYIRQFHHRVIVIKLGGSAMEEPEALRATMQDDVFMATVYTDDDTLAIVVRVLMNEINVEIVRHIRELGGRAVGPHGGAVQFLVGQKLLLPGADGVPIDLGRVGEVTTVDVELIRDFCAGSVIPVIPCVAQDGAGGWLNINADTAAAEVAAQLRAEKLVLLTDTPGILMDRADPESLIRGLDAAQVDELIRRRVIDEGMIPKVEACLDGLRSGVKKTHIIDGRLRHSLLLEIYTDRGVGTEIVL